MMNRLTCTDENRLGQLGIYIHISMIYAQKLLDGSKNLKDDGARKLFLCLR